MTYSQLYFSGRTDIQRLLTNIKPHTPRPRQCGRTYTTLMYMLGQVFYGLSNKIFLYVGENNLEADSLKLEFTRVLEGRGITLLKGSSHVKVPYTGQKFIFSTMKGWSAAARGYSIEIAFIDVFNATSYGTEYSYLTQVCKDIHRG